MASKRTRKAREVPDTRTTRPTDDGSPQAEKLPIPSNGDMERLGRDSTVLPGQDALPSYRPDCGREDHGFEP